MTKRELLSILLTEFPIESKTYPARLIDQIRYELVAAKILSLCPEEPKPGPIFRFTNDKVFVNGKEYVPAQQEPSKVWCKHLTWDDDAWIYHEIFVSGVTGENFWSWRLKDSCRWKLCPICGAGRPE